jgi:hypothetical protein
MLSSCAGLRKRVLDTVKARVSALLFVDMHQGESSGLPTYWRLSVLLNSLPMTGFYNNIPIKAIS